MNHNPSTVEKALTMYKETVSPTPDALMKILSQIPEQTSKQKGDQAMRSPYIWVAVTQAVTVCMVVLAVFPILTDDMASLYAFDVATEAYEMKLDKMEYDDMMLHYSDITNI